MTTIRAPDAWIREHHTHTEHTFRINNKSALSYIVCCVAGTFAMHSSFGVIIAELALCDRLCCCSLVVQWKCRFQTEKHFKRNITVQWNHVQKVNKSSKGSFFRFFSAHTRYFFFFFFFSPFYHQSSCIQESIGVKIKRSALIAFSVSQEVESFRVSIYGIKTLFVDSKFNWIRTFVATTFHNIPCAFGFTSIHICI